MVIKHSLVILITFGLFSASSLYTMDSFTAGVRVGYPTGLVPFVGQAIVGLELLVNKFAPFLVRLSYDEASSVSNGLLLGHSAGLMTYLAVLALMYRGLGKKACLITSLAIPATAVVVTAGIAAVSSNGL
jgi:hypothetical protein